MRAIRTYPLNHPRFAATSLRASSIEHLEAILREAGVEGIVLPSSANYKRWPFRRLPLGALLGARTALDFLAIMRSGGVLMRLFLVGDGRLRWR